MSILFVKSIFGSQTTWILLSGSFAGLDSVIRNRTEKGGIGFSAQLKSKESKDTLKILH